MAKPALLLAAALCCQMLGIEPAAAEACAFAVQGAGRVASVVDARSFQLADGSEVRLAGIEPVSSGAAKADDTAALSAMLLGEDVILRAEDDTPDRYGRQAAFVFLKSSGNLVRACCSPRARHSFPRR